MDPDETTYDASTLFVINGEPLYFDVDLIPPGELSTILKGQIREWGGRLVEPSAGLLPLDRKWQITLHDNPADTTQLEMLSRTTKHICLHWTFLLECYDNRRFLGPLDNDYAGHRYTLKPSSPATTAPPPASSQSPEYHGGSFAGSVAQGGKNRNGSSLNQTQTLTNASPRASLSSAGSSSFYANSISLTDIEIEGGSKDREQLKRRRSDKASSSAAGGSRVKRLKSDNASRGKSSSDLDGDPLALIGTSHERPVAEAPPSPPKKIVKNGWFGNEYTDEDREYVKKYVGWACRQEDDPDFKKMFREMARHAPHHKVSGWSHLFYKNETDFLDEIPELQRLYKGSSDESEEEAPRIKTARALVASHPLWKPKEKYLDESNVSEEDRRALIRFMANAPEGGVTQEELLQNFTHSNPKHSWRIWKRLIRENQASFDRAVAKKRNSLQVQGNT